MHFYPENHPAHRLILLQIPENHTAPRLALLQIQENHPQSTLWMVVYPVKAPQCFQKGETPGSMKK